MQQLKAANPGMKVLMYKNLSGMIERDQCGRRLHRRRDPGRRRAPRVVPAEHERQRFTFRYYDWIWAADIGNAGYQQQWADNVLAEIGADGLGRRLHGRHEPDAWPTTTTSPVAKYPTDAAYQAATGSALAAIGPRFRTAGKLVIPNIGSGRLPRRRRRLVAVRRRRHEREFVKWGNEPRRPATTAPVWERSCVDQGRAGRGQALPRRLALLRRRRRRGPLRLRHDAAGRRRQGSFALHNDYTNENWFSDYDYAIGKPAGAETKDASGVHRREFSNGLVLVTRPPLGRRPTRRPLHRLRTHQ